MIRTATQLKAKVRNLSGSDSQKAQTLIRNFIMERFLERIALSKYRNNFILKGGMLVAAVVGLDTRATLDIDTTIKSINLSKEKAERIVNEIIAVDIDDGMRFQISRITDIMEEHEYPGIRIVLDSTLENLRQTVKIDISTGDVITPGAIEYSYRLMFEDRAISLWAYNIETLLAEKLETILARGTANTRMRDFYDIHIITNQFNFSHDVFRKAFIATSTKRGTSDLILDLNDIIHNIGTDQTMIRMWEGYRINSFYVGELPWNVVMTAVKKLAGIIVPGNLSKEQLDAEIQKGYDDMLEGRTEPAKQVFEEIRKDYGF